MSSSWINGLKNLKIRVGGAVGSVTQQRQFGAQIKHVEVPQRPKKPLTPYFRYLGEVRSQVQRENPSLKTTELIKIVAQRWERLDDASKQNYMTSYKNDLASYSTILEKYKRSLTPEQVEAQEQQKLDKQLQKEKREKKRRLKDLGKPKKPATPFLRFLANNIPRGTKMSDYQAAAKQFGAKWKAMSDAEKQPYVDQFEAERTEYGKALIKWEDKMLKQGNEDLVREVRKNPPTRSRSKVKA